MPFGSRPAPDIVVGAGHNGLVAACYLARAGRDVVVLEALDRPGGGARTEQSVPGFRFDLHSVAHNIINMTDIPAELDLAGTGLVYREMDPFSIAVRPGAPTVRFYRSVERTVASIAEHDRRLADAYRSFVTDGTAILRTILPAMRGERATRDAWGIARGLAGIARAGPLRLARDLMAPYETTLRRRLGADWLAGPVAAFAAHGGVGPTAAGGSLYAYWQAAYHLFGQWHPNGGSQSLTDALVARLRSLGGQLRCAAPVEVIETTAGRVTGVRLAGGELVPAGTVTTAIDPKTALLELLRPALNGPAAADLEATRRSNVVQAVIHVATRSLPAYPDTRPGDWNGLQSYVDHVQHLSTAWTRAEAGILDDRPPLYAFTPSAIDNSLASPDSTPSTSPALPPLPASTAGGTPTPSGSSNAASAPSKNVPLASATTSSTSPSARPTPWKPNAGPAPTPCTSTSAGTRSASSAPPLPWPTGAPHHRPLHHRSRHQPHGGIAGTPGRQGALTLLADHRH